MRVSVWGKSTWCGYYRSFKSKLLVLRRVTVQIGDRLRNAAHNKKPGTRPGQREREATYIRRQVDTLTLTSP